MLSERSAVPCSGCTACCRDRQLIVLEPRSGDDIASFEAAATMNPLTGEPCWAIVHKPNGDCHYLGPDGCTIYDRAPAVCRAFDCRRALLRLAPDRASRRRLIQQSGGDSVLVAGRDRLHTLTADERAAP